MLRNFCTDMYLLLRSMVYSSSIPIEIFAFDLYNMGENAFRWGLNSVLTEPRVIKVVHDSRQLSDLLYHQFGGLLLENVFDTLAAHLVFSNWLLVDGAGRARPQQHNAVRDYLGISCEHIYVPRLGAAADLRLDTAHWLTRPLSQAQLLDAARYQKIQSYHSILSFMTPHHIIRNPY